MTGERWFWCLDHREAEQERVSTCRADRRLGPYPSREAAQGWRELAERRDERWEAEDRRWKGEPDD